MIIVWRYINDTIQEYSGKKGVRESIVYESRED